MKKKKTVAKKRPTPGERALAALREAHAHLRGEHVPGLVVHHAVDVAAIRKKTALSQAQFAERFGLEVSAVRDWEQGRRVPERSAQILLRVIESDPKAVERVVQRVA
jgi:putative transcriptional regulator